ncbi:hypothetical protein AVEN_5979-1, partial [Araneus ventricosus]
MAVSGPWTLVPDPSNYMEDPPCMSFCTCTFLHVKSIKSQMFSPAVEQKSAVLNAGYQVSLSHTSPTSLKTDAPPEVIWDIMRAWANMFPGKKSFELEPSKTIMSKES